MSAIRDAEPLRNVYQIDDLRITQPDVALERDASGVTNFAKLAPPAPAAKPEAKDEEKAPPLDLAVKHLAIDGGKVAFDDRLMGQRSKTRASPISMSPSTISRRSPKRPRATRSRRRSTRAAR